MALTKTTTVCFSLAALLAVLSASSAHAHTDSPFCATAADKNLCGELVNGAKTWEEAMKNGITGAVTKIKAGKHIVDEIPSKIPASVDPTLKESMAKTCKEAFEDLIDNFQMSIALVHADPAESLERRIGAPAFSECYDDIGGDHGAPMTEAREFGGQINKISETLLSVLEKKPKH